MCLRNKFFPLIFNGCDPIFAIDEAAAFFRSFLRISSSYKHLLLSVTYSRERLSFIIVCENRGIYLHCYDLCKLLLEIHPGLKPAISWDRTPLLYSSFRSIFSFFFCCEHCKSSFYVCQAFFWDFLPCNESFTILYCQNCICFLIFLVYLNNCFYTYNFQFSQFWQTIR